MNEMKVDVEKVRPPRLSVTYENALVEGVTTIVQNAAPYTYFGGRPVNVAVAANPDAAIHAARGLCGIHFIPAGRELEFLGGLGLARLVPALAGVGDERALELVETLRLWGIRSFRDFAALPENGIAERLGAEGVRLQQLARGTSRRSLVSVPAAPVYFHSVELEHPLDLREPLQFFLARLVHQLGVEIQVSSELGHASSFTLMLPAAVNDAQVGSVPQAARAR